MKILIGATAGIFGLAAIVGLGAPSIAQGQPSGAQTFAMCKGCHTIDKGGRNGIGPNLSGLYGRQAGTAPGYAYSAALKKSGIRWDEKSLNEFLAGPMRKVPGTKMAISVADPAKRAALVAYLKSATAG